MPSDVQFQSRNNIFEAERRVTLSKEGVLRIAAARGETRIPLSEVGLIELSAEASIASGISYVCQIYRRRAWFPAMTLKSKRYRGFNDFADARADYRAMMTALHAQIVNNAWPVRTQIAARPSAVLFGLLSQGHWAFLIWIAAFFVVLFALAATEPDWAAGRIPELSVGLAVLPAMAYLAVRFARIRGDYGPWPYDARAIPSGVLPEPLGVD